MEHSEVQDLKNEISSLRSEVGAVNNTLTEIKVTLARMDGQNLAARVFSLENKQQALDKYQAERNWIPDTLEATRDEVKSLNQFRWKAVGVLVVLQALFTGSAVAIIKWLYESAARQ